MGHVREHAQIVLLQRRACFHDVHDHIRKAQNGRKLDAAVQPDDLDLAALRLVILFCHAGVLRRHAQWQRKVLLPAVFRCHSQTAAAQLQIKQLIYIGLCFQQHVLAHHADVRRSVLHIDGHVAGLHQQVPHAALRVFKHQLPVVLVNGRAVVPNGGKQPVYLVAQASLGQGDIQHMPPPPVTGTAPSGPRRSVWRTRRPSGALCSALTLRPLFKMLCTARATCAGLWPASYKRRVSTS